MKLVKKTKKQYWNGKRLHTLDHCWCGKVHPYVTFFYSDGTPFYMALDDEKKENTT